jgi:hypothetical protein
VTIKTRFIAPLLAAGAVAAAIAAAPEVSAASTRTCNNSGAATTCHSPGNVEIHADRPQVQRPRIYGPFSSPIPFMFE